MPWIVWLYLVYFTILWSSGVLWGQDEDTAARAVVIVVVSLHFVAGGLFALMRGVSAALRERYLHPSVFMLNVLADSCFLWRACTRCPFRAHDLVHCVGSCGGGQQFLPCRLPEDTREAAAGHHRWRGRIHLFLGGQICVCGGEKHQQQRGEIHLHDPVSEEHVSVFKDSEPHALLQGSLPPNSSRGKTDPHQKPARLIRPTATTSRRRAEKG